MRARYIFVKQNTNIVYDVPLNMVDITADLICASVAAAYINQVDWHKYKAESSTRGGLIYKRRVSQNGSDG